MSTEAGRRCGMSIYPRPKTTGKHGYSVTNAPGCAGFDVLMTDTEARQKTCPILSPHVISGYKCDGSLCMAWEWMPGKRCSTSGEGLGRCFYLTRNNEREES